MDIQLTIFTRHRSKVLRTVDANKEGKIMERQG
jgi:hypothetical protein